MRNLEKESPDKISSISDPLLSLSSISLTKNDHDSPSFSSTSTLNNPKLLMLDPSGNGKNDNLLNENLNPFMKSTKSESMEEQGGKDTSDENTNLLNILNFGSKNKNGKSKKGVGKEKGKEKCKILQKNEQEEVEEEEESIGTIFSDLKKDSSLNLKLMNSNIENDPDILQDTTSSFLIVLEDADLWKKFNSVVNEMIITKSGRCLFPILRFQPINLEPKGQYSFAIDILQASPYKYKYRDKKWISGGIKFFAPPTQKKEYYHPDSPQTGFFFFFFFFFFICIYYFDFFIFIILKLFLYIYHIILFIYIYYNDFFNLFIYYIKSFIQYKFIFFFCLIKYDKIKIINQFPIFFFLKKKIIIRSFLDDSWRILFQN